jgi:nicotinamide-nucleotide adenylyltransferase
MTRKLHILGKRRRRVLYLGRFQPFHNGHLEVIRFLNGHRMEITLGLGCPLDGITFRNPFTFEERKLMVVSALFEARLSVYEIVRIDDINDAPRWVGHVKKLVGDFDMVFTNSSSDAELFEKAGEHVIGKGTILFDRALYKGTALRNLMACGNTDWEERVPPAVLKVLKDIGAEERVAKLWDGA